MIRKRREECCYAVLACVALFVMSGCAARSIRAEIDIAAPPAIVWEVLCDLRSYGAWNPFTPQIDGALAVGEKLVLHVQLVAGKTQREQGQRVTVVDPVHAIGWQTQVLSRRELVARRLQTLTPLPDGGTHYTTTDTFTGTFVPLVMSLYRKDLERGFAKMAESLKARAEALSLRRSTGGALAPHAGREAGRVEEETTVAPTAVSPAAQNQSPQ